MKKLKHISLFMIALGLILAFSLPAKAGNYRAADTDEDIYLNDGDMITGGTYRGKVYLNGGEIKGGEFPDTAEIVCSVGSISGGTFDCAVVTRDTSISGGTFNKNVEIIASPVYNGTFNSTVLVGDHGVVSGGTFNGEVKVDFYGLLDGGAFKAPVFVQGGSVQSGSFYNSLNVFSVGSGATIVSGGTIEAGGQLIIPSSSPDANLPDITNVTYKSSIMADISGLPESKWKDLFSANSTPYCIATLSFNPLRTMSIKNVRAGDYSRMTLSFDANGGSGTMADTYAYVKGNIRLPKNTFTNNGFSFKGWSDKITGPAKFKDEEDVNNVEKAFGASGTKTLYAIWSNTPDSKDITPSDNSGAPGPVDSSPAKKKDVVDSKQKTTSITNLSTKGKTLTVTWKKQSKGIKGYEIQYGTDKKFKTNTKSVTINKSKTTSKTFKKLKSGKKYFVRIRTYTNKKGKKVYSRWSKVKSIKLK